MRAAANNHPLLLNEERAKILLILKLYIRFVRGTSRVSTTNPPISVFCPIFSVSEQINTTGIIFCQVMITSILICFISITLISFMYQVCTGHAPIFVRRPMIIIIVVIWVSSWYDLIKMTIDAITWIR